MGIAAFLLLCVHLEMAQRYLFYYREQQQLFVYDLSFFCERYLTHGGLSLFVSQFIIQFFTMPYVGAIVTAAFGVLTAFFLWLALRKINNSVYLFPLCFLPVLFQVGALYDYYYYYYLMLYVLIVYAFNNQIRFNAKGEYNLPVGKRDFNKKMQSKLSDFINRLHRQDCRFTCMSFNEFDVSGLTNRDFVYVDPPYLITCATYNEQDGWNEDHEKELLHFLDELNSKGIRFALSNVLRSKGKENTILIEWLSNKKYKTHHLDYGYSNSNYQTKDKQTKSEEVLITNY